MLGYSVRLFIASISLHITGRFCLFSPLLYRLSYLPVL
jgi:hypothetical protein